MQSTVSEISTVFVYVDKALLFDKACYKTSYTYCYLCCTLWRLFGGDMQCFRPPSATLAVLVNDLSDYVCVRLQSHDLVMW